MIAGFLRPSRSHSTYSSQTLFLFGSRKRRVHPACDSAHATVIAVPINVSKYIVIDTTGRGDLPGPPLLVFPAILCIQLLTRNACILCRILHNIGNLTLQGQHYRPKLLPVGNRWIGRSVCCHLYANPGSFTEKQNGPEYRWYSGLNRCTFTGRLSYA